MQDRLKKLMQKLNKDNIVSIIFVLILITFVGVKLVLNKDNEIEKRTNEITKNKLAMYVNEGDGKYLEYKKDIFPDGYKLNIEKSSCVDNNGNELKEVTNNIIQDGNKITVKSNKTVYCTLYFDKKIAPKEFKFYIKEEGEEKYTKEITNIVHIEVKEDNVKEYCVSEEETSEHCNWQELNNKTIEENYTFTNEENEEKKVYAYVRNEYELDTQKEDKIIYDTIAPVINTLTVENITSRSYKGTISNVSDNLSGVDKDHFSNTGSNYSSDTINNVTYSGTKGATGTIYAYVTDKAGNESAIVNKSITIGGSGTSADPYHIYYIEDLVDLSNAVNKGTTYENQYFVLDRSLDFKVTDSYENSARTNYGDINGASGTQALLTELTTGKGFPSIGLGTTNNVTNMFNGNFDGKKYTISNLYQNVTTGRAGLFTYVGKEGSTNTFQNLTLTGNITKTGTDTSTIGGVIASSYAGTLIIDNIHNKASVTGTQNTGGIVGFTKYAAKITNSDNTGKVHGGAGVAGILGATHKLGRIEINSCYNTGDISASTNSASGIVATATADGNSTGPIIISNCWNSGRIQTSDYCELAGVVSYCNSGTLIIDRSYNTGQIQCTGSTRSSTSGTTGIVGNIYNGTALILNSYNTGNTISNSGTNAASNGIGFARNGSKLFVINSFNSGNQSGGGWTNAGIVSTDNGKNGTNTVKLYNVYNRGTQSGKYVYPIEWHASGTSLTKQYVYEASAIPTFTTLNNNKNAINLSSIDSNLSSYTLCNWKLGSDNYPTLNC